MRSSVIAPARSWLRSPAADALRRTPTRTAGTARARSRSRAPACVGNGREDLVKHHHARKRGDVPSVEARRHAEDVEPRDFGANERTQQLLQLPGAEPAGHRV